jgi:predicted nucleic acid-binding protein
MICVDASLAAKWLLLEEHSEKARSLYRVCIEEDQRIVAPFLLVSEITNILRQRMRGGQPPLLLAEAIQLLQQFLRMPIELTAPPNLYETALTFAATHDLPAAYDAHYLALAQLSGCNLWTDDQRLLRLLAGRLPFVKAIGDYAEGDPL